MKIQSSKLLVKSKEKKVSKSGKDYFSLGVMYEYHNEKLNEDFKKIEYVCVPENVFNDIEVGMSVVLLGYTSYSKDSGTSVFYNDFVREK